MDTIDEVDTGIGMGVGKVRQDVEGLDTKDNTKPRGLFTRVPRGVRFLVASFVLTSLFLLLRRVQYARIDPQEDNVHSSVNPGKHG